MPAPVAAYYAFESYPCAPRCLVAEARGHHLLERYAAAEAGFASLVRDRVLPLNKGRIWQAGGVTPYAQYVRTFNAWLFTASLPAWQRSWLQADE